MTSIPHGSRALLAAILAAGAPPLPAQTPPDWNSARVLELVSRARDVRQSSAVDSAFQSYHSNARGYVYFLFERPESDQRTLVKADQVALDVYWRAPNETKQEIIGQRDQKVLPTDIRYHIDHLTVVQDDFGDFIRMGDGDEVEAVLHPAGPGSQDVYDFLLADSLTVSYAAGTEEVRVYEVRVRPRDLDRPGFVGTVYLDRATAAIVRMRFSFTPASYIDPYVDYIRISLDNSLWMGRYWLPYRQEVEIRREIPMLDLSLGSVIQGRFDVRGYEFNVDLSDRLFRGQRVSAVSPAQRAAFPFERGLFDDLEGQGIDTSPSLEAVEQEVRQVVEERMLSGLAPMRLHFPAVSEVARYNRAEGVRLGGGLTLRPRADLTMRPAVGYSFGRARLDGSLSTSFAAGPVTSDLDVYWDALDDIGGYRGAEPLINTISAASGKKDYTDPYFRRGATLALRGNGGGGLTVGFRIEEHLGARDVVSDDPTNTEFRPVRSIDEGTLGLLTVQLPLALPGGGELRTTAEGGRMSARSFASVRSEARWTVRSLESGRHAMVSMSGGAVSRRAPVQALYLLGGRGTLPGQDYRTFVGDRHWLLRGEVTLPVLPPYVGVRLLGSVGATYLDGRALPDDWVRQDSDGLRGSVGGGLSLGWDSVRLDLSHGIRGGGWEAVVSVAEQFGGWM